MTRRQPFFFSCTGLIGMTLVQRRAESAHDQLAANSLHAFFARETANV